MTIRKQSTKNCPYCGEKILASAQKCKHCGEWLSDKPVNTIEPLTVLKQALFQKYEIIEKIGRGGMSTVYKAIQKSLHRPVALKILLPQFTEDQEFLERFHREAQAAAKINHPNIVTIYEEGVENGIHYIAMEYINGKDLHEIIEQNGALTITQIKEWLIPIVDGLAYAHRQGFIHRDIKSANILIDDKNRSILTDFGIVRYAENTHLTQTGTVLGTPEYMSPEQARGEPVDARSDIYSLGVVLYECLTGRLPFKSDTIFGTIHMIVSVEPTSPRSIRKQIPVKMENVVLRCLAKNPAERYQSCEELSEALKHGEAKRISSGENPKKFSKKAQSPLWIRVAMGLVSIVLIIILGMFIHQGDFFNSSTNNKPVQNENNWPKLTEMEKQRVLTLLKEADRFYINDQIFSPPENNAFELYQKVLRIQPNNKHALAQMELIRNDFLRHINEEFKKANYNKVLHLTKNALSYFKNDPKLLRLNKMSKIKILENKVRQLAKNKNFINAGTSNAYTVCQDILKLDAQNTIAKKVLTEIENWFAYRGNKAEQQKDWGKAASIYSKALQYFPKSIRFNQKLTLVQNAVLQKQQLFKNQIDSMLEQAKSLYNQNQFALAWQIYNEILSHSPEEEKAQLGKRKIITTLQHEAQKAFSAEHFGEAKKLYQLLNTLEPTISYIQKANIASERQKWLGLIDWVWIDGGTFKMGCNSGSHCEDDEKPKHTVVLNGFFISKYEITMAQFEKFIKDTDYRTRPEITGYSWIWDGEWYKKNGLNWKLDKNGRRLPRRDYDLPVTHVSWKDAVAFCNWLSEKVGTTVRLPTEAEWEYAARGGGSNNTLNSGSVPTVYAGSNDLNAVAWYFANSGEYAHPVGEKLPNNLGLYDMSGNVWEWCLDWYDKDYYEHSLRKNPKGPAKGAYRVVRGGCWDTDAKYVRITNRFFAKPSFSSNDLGFRIVRIR